MKSLNYIYTFDPRYTMEFLSELSEVALLRCWEHIGDSREAITVAKDEPYAMPTYTPKARELFEFFMDKFQEEIEKHKSLEPLDIVEKMNHLMERIVQEKIKGE